MESFEEWLKKNGKTVFTARHSDTNGLILVHSANGPDVQHWGILGMKWGVRRWQNEDGTLTPEGRIHYGRKEAKQFSKAKTYEKQDKIAKESKIIKDLQKSSGEYADLEEHYNYLKLLGENITKAQANEYTEHMHGVRDYFTDELKKYFNEDANEFIRRNSDFIDKNYEINQQTKRAEKRAAREALNKEDLDLIGEDNFNKDPERTKQAAKLGLKALAVSDRKGAYGDLDPEDADTRDWFVWEDQTIGLATIADMVNQGKSKEAIINIIKNVNDADYTYDEYVNNKTPSGASDLSYSGYSHGGEAEISDFIDKCIEIKKEESKIKHSDYDGGNTICLTKLF